MPILNYKYGRALNYPKEVISASPSYKLPPEGGLVRKTALITGVLQEAVPQRTECKIQERARKLRIHESEHQFTEPTIITIDLRQPCTGILHHKQAEKRCTRKGQCQ